MVDKALKAQAKIIEHFSKAKDLSSIMSMEVDEGRGDAKELQENSLILAKTLEIMNGEGVAEVIKAA